MCLVLAFLLVPGPVINWFVKPRIVKSFNKTHPAYLLSIAKMDFSIFANRFNIDAITLDAVDSTFSGKIGPLSVSGLDWMHLLWSGKLSATDYAGILIEADSTRIVITNSRYELRCSQLRVSASDSTIVLEDMVYRPLGDDEESFAVSGFRTTRYRLSVPSVAVSGIDIGELLLRKSYIARSAKFHDAFLDVLINKDKPVNPNSPKPLMPGSLLSLVPGILGVDSLEFTNGKIYYAEREKIGSEPALVTFDSIQLLVEGITNDGDSSKSIAVSARGEFMKAATMKILMSIPIVSPDLSFQYSGSLSRMDLTVFSEFTENFKQIRIKEGVLHEATFAIAVKSGRASGNVRTLYEDLDFAVVDEKSGSENGLSNTFSSLFFNTFKIRGNNMPNKSGEMKIGVVDYTLKPGEQFLKFAWSSIYCGILDIVAY